MINQMNTKQIHVTGTIAPAGRMSRPLTPVRPTWAQVFRAQEQRMAGACWRALRRVPLRRKAEFSVTHGPHVAWLSAWPAVAAMAMPALGVLACAELGMPASAGYFAGGALSALGLYLLAWIIGSRRLLGESGLSVTLDAIHLDLGLRGEATLPMAAVERCYDASALAGLAPGDVWTMTPSEEPNVLIALKGPATFPSRQFGRATTVTASFVALYADEPEAFIVAVANALPRRLRSFG
jgi:hypothetical protein